MKKPLFAIAAGLLVFAAAAPAAYAQADAAAEDAGAPIDEAVAFAKDLTDKATAALTSGKSEAEQFADFQAVLGEGLALDVIGKFMIGDIRKSMTPEQLARYDAAFPPYLTRLYADQFADIVGRPLKVIDSKALGARDVIVRTQFTRKEGGPINVDWRIRKLRTGEQKAIDIIVGGVSIMLVKREEFSAFIAQNSIDALIERIEKEGKNDSSAGLSPSKHLYELHAQLLNNFVAQYGALGGSAKIPQVKHVELVKSAVRDQLVDPSSAEFYDVKEVGSGDKKYICGEVNSKNRFGGYVGKRIFIGAGMSARIQSHEDNAAEAAFLQLYLDRCLRAVKH